jgi:hypothetical protein
VDEDEARRLLSISPNQYVQEFVSEQEFQEPGAATEKLKQEGVLTMVVQLVVNQEMV